MKIKELFEQRTQINPEQYVQQYTSILKILDKWRKVSFDAGRTLKTNNLKISKTGLVSGFTTILVITDEMVDENGELELKLGGTVPGIGIGTTKLKSFKNFPKKIGDSGIWIGGRGSTIEQSWSSWEGFPQQILGNVAMYDLENANYKGIGNYPFQYGSWLIKSNYSGPLLGFLKHKSINGIYAMKSNANKETKLSQAVKIINPYIKGNKDILACQDELIDNGLKEFAKL